MKPAADRWDVAIWGTYPPPFGGMATHIVRLMHYLKAEGLRARVFNRASDAQSLPEAVSIRHCQRRWFVKFALFARDRMLYVFTGRPSVRFLAYILRVLRGKRYILRIGEERIFETFARGSRVDKWMTRVALRHADHVIAVSPHFVPLLESVGVKPGRIHVIPGFIPPINHEENPPEDVITFARDHHPVLAANGQLADINLPDAYGFDLLVRALELLKDKHPRIGLVLSLYGEANQIVGLEELRRMIRDKGLEKHVCLRTEPHSFWPTLKYADVMIRPTRTEGDSGSIREAMYLGVPVVASDATPRPAPTVLFKNGSTDDLLAVTSEVIENYPKYRAMFANLPYEDNAKPVLALIRSCLAPKSR
ncbi:MAG: glycosyltransferase family 4 protein [Planctomycetota bacterium]|nr:glycosyltransferase family 4 protein [Planctomycetota bacterium]